MGTSSLMGIATKAMFANYAALQTTGNNIANANTAGYSRQTVNLETAKGQFTGAGFFGQGVNVKTVTRSYDQFLTAQSAVTRSIASADSTRHEQLTQLENVFPLGEAGIGHSAGEMINAFVDVANNPQDDSARAVVLTRAREMSVRFKTAADQISSLQAGVSLDIGSAIDSVNGLAKQVAGINNQIAASAGTGHIPNDLYDERDRLVNEINSYINVSTIQADDGSVSLFIGGGQSLVLGSNVSTLKATADQYDPSIKRVALVEGGVDRPVLADSITGGVLSGLMKFQDSDLAAARNLIGQMAVAISGAMNQQQSLGLDAGVPPSAGVTMFSLSAPRALPANANVGDGAMSLGVADYSHVQASDYEVRYDGTAYSITRLSDNTQVVGSPFADLSAGVQFDGLSLQLSSGTVASGDRFLLQATSQAANDMKLVLSNPKGIAAASPISGSLPATNTGSATIASLGVVDTATFDPTLSARFTFNSATGDYAYDLMDAANTVVSSGTGTWTAGSPIDVNGFRLTLNGVPRNGDVINIQPTTAPQANNSNALAFIALGNTNFVGINTVAGGEIPGRTITDAYANALSDIGVRVQSAKTAAGISGSIAATADTTLANRTGVNLDEEAARLIQFQQSYQAAARMLQVAQNVFDSLLQAAGN